MKFDEIEINLDQENLIKKSIENFLICFGSCKKI